MDSNKQLNDTLPVMETTASVDGPGHWQGRSGFRRGRTDTLIWKEIAKTQEMVDLYRRPSPYSSRVQRAISQTWDGRALERLLISKIRLFIFPARVLGGEWRLHGLRKLIRESARPQGWGGGAKKALKPGPIGNESGFLEEASQRVREGGVDLQEKGQYYLI